MKKVNVRFILLFFAVLVPIGMVGYVVHAYQVNRHATFFLDRAERASYRDEMSVALQELTHYLTLVPEDAAARARMGMWLAETGQDYAAFTVLERVLREADSDEARRALVEVLLRMRRWNDARSHLEQLRLAAPRDPVLLDRLAQCEWAAENYAEAAALLETVMSLDPHQIDSCCRLISLIDNQPTFVRRESDAPARDADYWRQRMVEANKDAISVYLTRAESIRAKAMQTARGGGEAEQKLEDALADAKQARELARRASTKLTTLRETLARPDGGVEPARELLGQIGHHLASLRLTQRKIDAVHRMLGDPGAKVLVTEGLDSLDRVARAAEADALWLAANCLWGMARSNSTDSKASQLDEARELAKAGVELTAQDDRLFTTLAEIELAAGDRSAAKEWLRQGCETIEGQSSLAVNLARMRLDDGETTEARQTIGVMATGGYPRPLIDYLAARAECADGNWQQATRLLSRANSQVAETPELAKEIEYWLGKSYQHQQKFDLELQAYRRALVIDPLYKPARLGLADALRRQGQFDMALEQYRAGLDENPESALLAVQVRIQKNLSIPPSRRQWTEIEVALNHLSQALPDNPHVPLLHADVLAAQGKTQEAKELLEAAREKSRGSVVIRCALAQLAMQNGAVDGLAEAARLLDEATTDVGDCVDIRLTRGNLAVRRDGAQAGAELRTLSADSGSFNEQDRLRLWSRLAQLALACGDVEQALQLTSRVADAAPHDLNSWLQLLAIQLERKDYPAVDKVLAKIAGIEGGEEGHVWSYCQAATLAARADETSNMALRAQALQHNDKALAKQPDWPPALLLGATLSEQQGDPRTALHHYLKLIELGNDTARVAQEAIRLLTAEARYEEADALLTRWEQQSNVIAPDLQRFRSRIAAGLEDLEAALPAARNVAKESQNHQDHLWLVRLCGLYAVQKQHENSADEAAQLMAEGESAMQRARELAPEAADVWAVEIQFFVRLGRQEEVDKRLKDAQVRFADVPATLANLYLAAGQEQQAANQFEADLNRWPQDIPLIRRAAEFSVRTGRPQIATAPLHDIVTGQTRADLDDVVWARRTLAIALRTEGGTANLDAALALVEENLKSRPSSVLDLRTKAMILADDADPARRDTARQILEHLIRDRAPGVAETRHMLVQMYLADGNWTGALPHLRLATDPSTISRYVQGMLDRSQLDEAELGLARLAEVAPSEPGTMFLQSRFLFRRGEHERALGVIDALVARSVAPSESSGDLLRAATLAEEFARHSSRPESAAFAASCRKRAESYLRQRAPLGSDEEMDLVAFLARDGQAEEALKMVEQNMDSASVPAIARGIASFAEAKRLDDQTRQHLNAIIESAIAAHGRPLELLDAKARVLVGAERFDEATSVYREILAAAPQNCAVKNNLAELLGLQRLDLEWALSLIQETIQVLGPQPALLDTRATINLARGNSTTAIDDMQLVVAAAPRPNRYFHLATALQAAGRSAEAQQALRQAHALGLAAEHLHPLERESYRRLLALFR